MSYMGYIADDEDVVDVAAAFAEELRARAPEFEQQGYVSQDLANRLAELGLFRLCNPKNYGGPGRSPKDYGRLVEAGMTALPHGLSLSGSPPPCPPASWRRKK